MLIATLLACLGSTAWAEGSQMDGPVVGGSFGMGGADYYGDTRDRMPFTWEAPPHPIGLTEMERFRAAHRNIDKPVRRRKRHNEARHDWR